MSKAAFPQQHSVHLGMTPAESLRWASRGADSGMSVFRLDFTGIVDRQGLIDYLRKEFVFPYRVFGLDAVVSLMSDLEWVGNDQGHVVIASGCDNAPVVAALFASILPNVVDRWRTRAVPFVVLLDSQGSDVRSAVLEANEEMAAAGRLPWAQPGTGSVDIVVHGQ
ncbi:hypothetical protein [Paenarthrobacter sp. NPDC090522]|uniref:barstar family protein n=1 Tax=Paenarthrobacter sp. NPDC090522 TaxID=3364383 RepID=UPI0038219B67